MSTRTKPYIIKETFYRTTQIIEDLLEMYEIDTNDPDVQQNIVNTAVCLENAYLGYDDSGRLIGVESASQQ